uniref:Uncharacterized protein n=1 Tax=Anguilla anguilla TaxID=7936 RepID=A0A0E9Q704_ANGAN
MLTSGKKVTSTAHSCISGTDLYVIDSFPTLNKQAFVLNQYSLSHSVWHVSITHQS